MNADLHLAQDLAATGTGNLFVIFGEPDVEVFPATPDVPSGNRAPERTSGAGPGAIQVKVLSVDIFAPRFGKVRSVDVDGIACSFIDTNYNGEAFFVSHAYFLGANTPYQSLNHPQSRSRPRSLGHPQLRHQPPLPQAGDWADCGEDY